MLRPRTRLISLRITEEEYEAIRQASEEGGARCVSEFARSALLGSAHSAPPPDQPPACSVISCFDVRLTRVEKELAQVTSELHTHLNDAGKDGE